MPHEKEDRKKPIDWWRLIVYIIIAGGYSILTFFRVSFTWDNYLIGLAAALLVEAVLVWGIYQLDNGRRL